MLLLIDKVQQPPLLQSYLLYAGRIQAGSKHVEVMNSVNVPTAGSVSCCGSCHAAVGRCFCLDTRSACVQVALGMFHSCHYVQGLA